MELVNTHSKRPVYIRQIPRTGREIAAGHALERLVDTATTDRRPVYRTVIPELAVYTNIKMDSAYYKLMITRLTRHSIAYNTIAGLECANMVVDAAQIYPEEYHLYAASCRPQDADAYFYNSAAPHLSEESRTWHIKTLQRNRHFGPVIRALEDPAPKPEYIWLDQPVATVEAALLRWRHIMRPEYSVRTIINLLIKQAAQENSVYSDDLDAGSGSWREMCWAVAKYFQTIKAVVYAPHKTRSEK